MSRLDDRLRQELERAARPAVPADVFERVDRRRARRHVLRRLQTATLVVVVLAGTAGGFVFLSDAFHDGSASIGGSVTPLPSATTTAPSGPIDIGLGFPVCDVRTMHTDLDGNGTVDAVSVATKISDAPDCPAPGTSTEVLVIDLNGDGKADAVGGPLSCPTGCEPFATPDINGDGLPEIALVVDRPGDGPKRIQLWDLTTPPGGSLAVIPFVDANGDPATFSWGTVDNARRGRAGSLRRVVQIVSLTGILTSAPLVRRGMRSPPAPAAGTSRNMATTSSAPSSGRRSTTATTSRARRPSSPTVAAIRCVARRWYPQPLRRPRLISVSVSPSATCRACPPTSTETARPILCTSRPR